jgi:hypothetical protein
MTEFICRAQLKPHSLGVVRGASGGVKRREMHPAVYATAALGGFSGN